MKRSKEIQLAPSLESFFDAELGETARKQGVEMTAFTREYLARMLVRFSQVEHLFKPTASGEWTIPTLTELYSASVGHPLADQFSKMQQMGDLALFTSGFLSERIEKSLIDMDYYIAMGEVAYEKAGHIRETIGAERVLNIYFELAHSFPKFVEVMNELADQSLLSSDRDVVKLYEKWLRTGSGRIERMLAEVGVIAAKGSSGN